MKGAQNLLSTVIHVITDGCHEQEVYSVGHQWQTCCKADHDLPRDVPLQRGASVPVWTALIT